MRNFVAFLLGVIMIFSAQCTEAAVETFTGVGEYTISKFETIDVGQQYALQEAQRNVVMQAGVYVHSFSHSANSTVVSDEVVAVASNVLKIHNRTFQNSIDAAGNVKITATISADVDSSEVEEGMKRSDLGIIAEKYMQLQKEYDKQKAEIEKLKLSNLTVEQVEGIKVNLKNLAEALRLDEEGNRLYYEKRYDEALAKYNESISLNPDSSNVYAHRALVYLDNKAEITKALMDTEKAISLDPKNVIAYINRGIIYRRGKDNLKAVLDFEKAVELNANNSVAYFWLGKASYSIDRNKSVESYTKAIDLNPNYAEAFAGRAFSKSVIASKSKDINIFKEAIFDATRAIDLNPYEPEWYINRAEVYQSMVVYYNGENNHRLSIDYEKKELEDLKRARDINPNHVSTHYLGKNLNENISYLETMIPFSEKNLRDGIIK